MYVYSKINLQFNVTMNENLTNILLKEIIKNVNHLFLKTLLFTFLKPRCLSSYAKRSNIYEFQSLSYHKLLLNSGDIHT